MNNNEEILAKFCELRDKAKQRKNSKYKSEYFKYREMCLSNFDYLVKNKTQKYKKFTNYEDLYQDGRIALLAALNTYSPDKGNFYWWADKYIKTRLSREANRHSTIKIPIKKTKTIQPYKVSQLPTVIDLSPSALDEIMNQELKKEISNALGKLPDEQRIILELNGIKSYSINQISKELNIKKSECIKLLKEAKKNLRNYLEEETGFSTYESTQLP